jgi:transcriptional regulator of acetoin/glycerol metabolism
MRPGHLGRRTDRGVHGRLILYDSGVIDAEVIELRAAGQARPAAATDLGNVEREMIARMLRDCRWNKLRAPARVGLSRTQLYHRMRKHGIEEPPVR